MHAVHGWTPDHRLMLGCLEPLFAARPGHRRLYPDLPAMRKSPADDVKFTDDVLAALEEFVDEHIGGPFLLIGESYGGYLARAMAHRRPDQVAGLALICPTGTNVHAPDRTVPPFEVRRSDGVELEPELAAQFDGMAVVRTAEAARRFAEEILPGVQVTDRDGMARHSALAGAVAFGCTPAFPHMRETKQRFRTIRTHPGVDNRGRTHFCHAYMTTRRRVPDKLHSIEQPALFNAHMGGVAGPGRAVGVFPDVRALMRRQATCHAEAHEDPAGVAARRHVRRLAQPGRGVAGPAAVRHEHGRRQRVPDGARARPPRARVHGGRPVRSAA